MSQGAQARPIHSQGLLLAAVASGVLLLAIYLTQNIIESENGGISAAVRTIGAALAIWALVRPKAGLYIITVEGFSLDFVKKVSVYYGTASMNTIIEVLVIGMLATVATVLGVLIQSVALRRYKLVPTQWVMLALAAVACMAIFFAAAKNVGIEKAGEDSFNSCFYIALALPMSVAFTDREQVRKLLSLQFFLAAIWAVWGIKQYYSGFTAMEWYYAETGLSVVASAHMITVGDARPFGFGTGVSNYSVLSAYFSFGVWYLLNYRRQRLIYLLGTATIFWGVVTSLQRTSLAMPFLVLVFFFALQTMRRSFLLYGAGAILFLLGVYYAETLLLHFDDINSFISVKGDWAETVINIDTYSARVGSWTNLKDPALYSLFGLDHTVESHDVFTKIIASYGVVGLVLSVSFLGWGAWFVQRTVLRVEDPHDRQFAIFCLAVTVPSIAVGFIGDGNFTATPVNLQIWSFFGAAICMVVNSRLAPAVLKPAARTLNDLLEASGPRVPMAAQAALTRSGA